MSELPHHGRYDYRPIVGRPDYSWPEERRLAIYLGVNHEVFAFGDGMGAELAPSKTQPDVMNFAWRDYGNRVGAWRFMEMFDRLELKTTALINSAIIKKCPGLAEACRDRGDEIAAHGRTNAQAEGEQSEDEERAMIARTLDEFAAIGVRPRGWLGPWISESHRTPDLLEEAGFDYVLDWAHDDQPTRLKTRSGKGILAIPYVLAGGQRHSFGHRPPSGGDDLRRHDRRYRRAVAQRMRSPPLRPWHRSSSLHYGAATPGASA